MNGFAAHGVWPEGFRCHCCIIASGLWRRSVLAHDQQQALELLLQPRLVLELRPDHLTPAVRRIASTNGCGAKAMVLTNWLANRLRQRWSSWSQAAAATPSESHQAALVRAGDHRERERAVDVAGIAAAAAA